MKSPTIRHLLALVLFGLLILLDQWTKHWVEFVLQPRGMIVIIPGFFNLTYVRNTGIAFGLFGGNNQVFVGLSSVLILAGLFLARNLNWQRWETNLLAALLLAGAVGNLLDRFFHGYVTDFLDFNLILYRWPAFNVADSCITVSVIWILYRTIWAEEESQ